MSKTRNGVTVTYTRSNEMHDIYFVSSENNEPGDPSMEAYYHEELRNTGSNEEYVLSMIVD